MSDLHHFRLSGQRNQWRQALAGVGQSAVDVELQVHVVTPKTAESQDDGVSAAVGHVSVLQVNGVDLPVSSDVTDQDWRRRTRRRSATPDKKTHNNGGETHQQHESSSEGRRCLRTESSEAFSDGL